ncbi:MAG: periplasmic heavy metal sensor [Parvibaculaceae bacterium]
MADQADTPKRSWFQAWPHWTMFLLVASLAVNLLIAGALGMRYFSPERLERWSGASFTQLLPRRFLSDLPEDRRREFLDLLKSRREVFRESRAGMRDVALRFAGALERDPYSEAEVDAAIQDFTKLSTQMVDSGTQVTLDIVKKLSPQERGLLAKQVRERVERMRERRKKWQKDKGDDE